MKWCFIGIGKNYKTGKKNIGGFWSTYDSYEGEYDEGLSNDYDCICKYSFKEVKEEFDKPIFPFIYEGIYSLHFLVPSWIAFVLLAKTTIQNRIALKKCLKEMEFEI